MAQILTMLADQAGEPPQPNLLEGRPKRGSRPCGVEWTITEGLRESPTSEKAAQIGKG